MKSPPKGQEIGIGKPQVATALTRPGRDIVIKVTQIHKVHSQHTFLTRSLSKPKAVPVSSMALDLVVEESHSISSEVLLSSEML